MPTPDLARTDLPIPSKPHTGLITFDAKDPDTKFAPITPLRLPARAPNVLVVLIDDAGFGSSTAFGGPCSTPTFERLAGEGQPVPHHRSVFAHPPVLADRPQSPRGRHGRKSPKIATSAPGYNSIRPDTAAPLAETLKLNGYSTAQFGKCHEVPVWESSPLGPFNQWPLGSGFEYFYGFVGAETNQWYPALYEA